MNVELDGIDLSALKVIHYPDPRLRKPSAPVTAFDDALAALAGRMFELMFQARGVGLAATQVGIGIRMFVSSPSYEEADRRVYVNPQIVLTDGEQESDEGCLSLPGISCKLKRFDKVTIRAADLQGRQFEETGQGLLARIFQHEMDHLDGRLILDRMGSVAKLANRRAIKELEDELAK